MQREVLDPRAFQEIRRLNSAFIGLLHHCHGSALEARLDDRTGLLEMIVSLSPLEAQVLCTARAALFSLRLDIPVDQPPGVAETPVMIGPGIEDGLVREFGLVASGYAWHLSQISPLAASLLLGWSRDRVQSFASLNLAQVVRATLASSPSVGLRMCAHPRFWQDLIAYVRQQNGKGWEVAQTWSTQFFSREV